MTTLPAFQAQNPAISGYSLGWSSCTAFAGAMAGSFDKQVAKAMTGGQVRSLTHDTIGGLTLAQVDASLLFGWDVNVATSLGMDWALVEKAVDAGKGVILQGWYAPIAATKFDAGRGFKGNHAVFIPPNWGAMDPLADGRASGVYKYHGEAYPRALLKEFAGRLNLDPGGYRPLGMGKAYASLTADRVAAWQCSVNGFKVGVYEVIGDTVVSARVTKTPATFTASCTAPHLYRWPGHTSQSLVKVLSGSHAGWYIRSTHAKEV